MNFLDGSLFPENQDKLVITCAPYGPEWIPSDFPQDIKLRILRDASPELALRVLTTMTTREARLQRALLVGDTAALWVLVRERNSDLHWPAVWLPRNGHPAAFCLNDEIVTEPRAVLAKPGDRTPDQLRAAFENVWNDDSALLEHRGPEVVEHGVGTFQETVKHVEICWLVEVEGKTELVAVDAEVVRALASRVEWRAPFARFVTTPWPFNLDHIGTEVAEGHGRQWAGEHACQIENSNSGER